MRIGIDLDEVLADFMVTFLDHYNVKFKTTLTKEQFSYFDLTKNIQASKEELFVIFEEFYLTDHFENLPPVTDAISSIDKLSKKHELYVITARTPNITEHTLKWVNKHFPNKFKYVHFAHNPYFGKKKTKSKAEFGTDLGIDLLIEDNLDFATEAAKENIKVFLFDAPWNKSKSLPKNIKRVKSWKEILRELI